MSRFVIAVRGFLAALCLMPGAAIAAEPVKRVAVYVEPFYNSGATGQTPKVAVGKAFDAQLASGKREDLLAVRDAIVAKPGTVTPMTMMVLAIRFYDAGLRDDAVFWFYAAKDRFITLSEVAVPNAPQLAQAEDAVKNFATLAGPIINGYAFCDLAKQKDIRQKALAWVEANPYEVAFMTQLPARGADRKALLAAAVGNAKANAAKERAYFDDPKTVETYYATRKKNEADVKYCWKSE